MSAGWKTLVAGIVIGMILSAMLYALFLKHRNLVATEGKVVHQDHITYVNEAFKLSKEREARADEKS